MNPEDYKNHPDHVHQWERIGRFSTCICGATRVGLGWTPRREFAQVPEKCPDVIPEWMTK